LGGGQTIPGHKNRKLRNVVAMRIFEPKREKVTGGLRKFHNEKCLNLYSSSYFRAIKPRRMRWRGMRLMRNTYRILDDKSEGKRSLGLGIDVKIILECI
jgi:hypothetical protein